MSGSTAWWRSRRNYRKSGFRIAWNNVRHEGPAADAKPPAGVSLVDARSVPFDRLAAYDRRFFPEARDSFLASWITLPERAAMVALRDGEIVGFARHAGLPGGARASGRCSPSRPRSPPSLVSASRRPEPARRPWRSTCRTSTSRPSRSPNSSG